MGNPIRIQAVKKRGGTQVVFHGKKCTTKAYRDHQGKATERVCKDAKVALRAGKDAQEVTAKANKRGLPDAANLMKLTDGRGVFVAKALADAKLALHRGNWQMALHHLSMADSYFNNGMKQTPAYRAMRQSIAEPATKMLFDARAPLAKRMAMQGNVKGTEAMVEFITKYAPDRKGEVDYLVSVARHHRNVAHRDKRWTDGNMTLRMRTVRARQEYVSLKGIVRRLEGDGSTPKDKLALYQQLLNTARLRHNKYLQLLRIQ